MILCWAHFNRRQQYLVPLCSRYKALTSLVIIAPCKLVRRFVIYNGRLGKGLSHSRPLGLLRHAKISAACFFFIPVAVAYTYSSNWAQFEVRV